MKYPGEVLPDADIVYDHFHIIKSMNDKLNTLRRSTMNQLEGDQKKELKDKRFLMLRNKETLSAEAREELGELRERFEDLGTASVMKGSLRNIYRLALGASLAKKAFEKWFTMADESGITCLKAMAKTNRKRIQGLLAYWNHGCLTSASQEVFNNKIGWLTRQAYGYRDEHYLHLKIYDLPNLSTRRGL